MLYVITYTFVALIMVYVMKANKTIAFMRKVYRQLNSRGFPGIQNLMFNTTLRNLKSFQSMFFNTIFSI